MESFFDVQRAITTKLTKTHYQKTELRFFITISSKWALPWKSKCTDSETAKLGGTHDRNLNRNDLEQLRTHGH